MTTENMISTPVYLSDKSQWFGFLTGPITWFIHFVVFYVIAEFGCTPVANGLYYSYTAIRLTLFALTAIAVVITLIAGVVAYQNLRRIPRERTDDNMKLERGYYMSWLGVVSSVAFAVAMVVEVSVLFFFSSCSSIMG